jgi:hypothetical protein
MAITCKCGAVHATAAEAVDHLELYHGFTGPSRTMPAEPETFTVSPRGLADQFGLSTYESE